MSTAPPTHLDPSELGTRAYWDSAYSTERANFASNADDEGTVWFSDAGAEERMLSFLEDLADEGELRKGDEGEEEEEETGKDKLQDGVEKGRAPTRFLDLGTGNGHLLFALRDDGWEGEMFGVDYSAQSIRLANEILQSKYPTTVPESPASTSTPSSSSTSNIHFLEWDILTSAPGPWLHQGFDVVLDKGTFDAICLSQETDAQGRRICEGYAERVVPLVRRGGRFLITSCNWTHEEVRGWFEGAAAEGFVYEGKVAYPSFTFGGKQGSSVCTLCFRRR